MPENWPRALCALVTWGPSGGALLESEGVDETILQSLDKALKPTSASIPFVPGKIKRGKFNRRWGVVMNEV